MIDVLLTPAQREAAAGFDRFTRETVAPAAAAIDREERLPEALVQAMARAGYLGAIAPASAGGAGMDMVTFGLLNASLNRACASTRSLITVHSMAIRAIDRWGSAEQKARWLSPLARGEAIGAFALTEPDAGSDAKGVQTTARAEGSEWVLDGTKRWITFGQIADVFLLFARAGDKLTAFVVPSRAPGLEIHPMRGLLGARASMLAELRLTGCRVPAEARIGGVGFGFSVVGNTALDYGRYSVAWGCAGAIDGCLEASAAYAAGRVQFGRPIGEHQLVRRMLTDMITSSRTATALCLQAGLLHDRGDKRAAAETSIAKYHASTAFARAAADAVQIHGAAGCVEGSLVERFYRDAKVMEIIEGSNEIQQITIPKIAEVSP